MLRIKSIIWLISFNVIHYSSPLLFSLHLWIHLCLQSDSGVVLSGQSDKLPANNKKKKKKMRDTQHLFIPFFLFHPFVIWFLYSLLGLVALCLRLLFRVCTLFIFWKHRVIAASVQCIHPLLFSSFHYFPPLCSSFWFNHRSGQTHHQTPLTHLWLQDGSSVVDFPPLSVDLDLIKIRLQKDEMQITKFH